jgi:hypothetical protein
MKLAEHTEHIRQLIESAFLNRLGRMGINEGALIDSASIPSEYKVDRARIEVIREVFIAETGSVENAYEKLIEELTFTLFNRLAALKVMEAHTLHPEIVTQREIHGSRSFAHLAWLEQNQNARNEEAEGLVMFFEQQLQKLAGDIPLFNPKHPYHLLPTPLELKNIIIAFNSLETDSQVEPEIWKSDDVLGWLYESYNNYKKAAHKASGEKTEFNKVSIQSQVYTPKWVVKFLVDNSLGKLYLEMYPNSDIKTKYKIANAPVSKTRALKPLHEIKLIDPSNGSGNYLLYAFDLYHDIYLDNINEQGNPNNYDEADIAKLIIEHNLHGVDLDDRAVQLAQLGLYIKAKRKKRTIKIEHFNIVSSDFFLPNYEEVKGIFEENAELGQREKAIVADLWEDLQNAYKFGSLIRLEEKLSIKWFGSKQQSNENQITMFGAENVQDFENFKEHFFLQLQKAVTQNTDKQGQTFLNTKTQDAITFLEVLSQKYDVAVANPPYTNSADFGPELKRFIEANYKQPYKFNTNLYATFIKRCFELINEGGKMALIHPLTFMYIKTFEDVRKFILEKTHIDVFVDYGLSNLFGSVMVDPAFYVLEKNESKNKSLFISLDQYTRTPNEKNKKEFCLQALEDHIMQIPNKHNITLPQEKLKIIESFPFIYWISDGFREKFSSKKADNFLNFCTGSKSGDNDRFIRFWWEVDKNKISKNYKTDKLKWTPHTKGGPFVKWYGNNWTVINWENDAFEIKSLENSVIRNERMYFNEGITYSSAGSKGASFRYLPPNFTLDAAGSGIYPTETFKNIPYALGLLNSPLVFYIIDCLNPTVNTNPGDLSRIPFIEPEGKNEELISNLVSENISINKQLNSFKIIENNYERNPISIYNDATLKSRVKSFLNFENFQITKVLLNESIINNRIFETYEISELDRLQIEAKMGISIGSLPLSNSTKEAFLKQIKNPSEELFEHIQSLSVTTFGEQQVTEIKEDFVTLYQSNNGLEEFCIRHKVNPINVWYWFNEANLIPQARAEEITLEYITDVVRTLLMVDEDGIIPLVGLPGEPRLLERIEQHYLNNGLTSAQFMQLDGLLGKPINDFIEQNFFRKLSDHLNLFMYLPKTPFIWHLSSGQYQGFEAYIIIYKWNTDSLFKLKSHYLSKRVESLDYRLIQLQGIVTAQAQTEKEVIRLQLKEIEIFTAKIDDLIAEGYNPKLDDGVAKNIAPLQKKGLLKAEVLNAPQLTKYLNADW